MSAATRYAIVTAPVVTGDLLALVDRRLTATPLPRLRRSAQYLEAIMARPSGISARRVSRPASGRWPFQAPEGRGRYRDGARVARGRCAGTPRQVRPEVESHSAVRQCADIAASSGRAGQSCVTCRRRRYRPMRICATPVHADPHQPVVRVQLSPSVDRCGQGWPCGRRAITRCPSVACRSTMSNSATLPSSAATSRRGRRSKPRQCTAGSSAPMAGSTTRRSRRRCCRPGTASRIRCSRSGDHRHRALGHIQRQRQGQRGAARLRLSAPTPRPRSARASVSATEARRSRSTPAARSIPAAGTTDDQRWSSRLPRSTRIPIAGLRSGGLSRSLRRSSIVRPFQVARVSHFSSQRMR
jgi:hypothetical protein